MFFYRGLSDNQTRSTATNKRRGSKCEKREVTTSGFILCFSCIDAFFQRGRSYREEPSGGSDELSLQLLFVIINFVISTTKRVIMVGLSRRKSCLKPSPV